MNGPYRYELAKYWQRESHKYKIVDANGQLAHEYHFHGGGYRRYTEAAAEQIVEHLNFEYAKRLMTQGTKAEGM